MSKEILLAATLSRWGHLFNVKLFELTKKFGSLEKLHDQWQRHNVPANVNEKLAAAWSETQLAEMEELLHRHTIHAIHIFDDNFPKLLREILDPPYVLYAQGDVGWVNQLTLVSCVGTRRMTTYGKRAVEHCLASLEGRKVGVISGLALGIDGQSHRVAIDHNIPTAAVLAGGLDAYEPPSHAPLARSILDHRGCLLSEYPPGLRPQPYCFLERNRIIAGLSQATIIIEGRHQSGSLVTGRNALVYGRDVGAVPGDIFLPNSEGPLRLIRDGAAPITHANDVLALLGFSPEPEAVSAQNHGPIFALLQQQSATADTIAEQLQLPGPFVAKELTLLELHGLIQCTANGLWYCSAKFCVK